MSQLMLSKLSLEFLPMTETCTIDEMRSYIGDLYVMAVDGNAATSPGGIRQHIPSKFDIMQASWDFFNDQYIQYVLSGNGEKGVGRDVMNYLDSGMSLEEVYQIISDIRENNASYNTHMELDGEVEKKSLRDIQKLLRLFNVSFFNDDSEGFFLSELELKDWVNPPFLKVW